MTNNLFEVTWDRGKRTAEEVEEKHIYKFICEDCGCNDLLIEPYDIPYLHEVDNKDLPREYAITLYTNALRLDKAIIASGQIRVVCNECEMVFHYTKDRIREDFVRKWYSQIFKKGAMDLNGGVGSDIK